MERKWKKILFVLIICAMLATGLNLIFKPFDSERYDTLQSESNAALSDMETTMESLDSKNNDVSNVTPVSNHKEEQSKEVEGGKISIPSLNIELAILEGSTQENLDKGATTLIENKVMGEGNYSLAAHHMRDESLFFGKLDQIEEGTYIYITDYEYIYTYKYKSIKEVHESEVDILEDHGKDELTLITCDKPTATEYRTVVTAELTKKEMYKNDMWESEK
ncbi:class A sortase [Terribacillus saccharophilus]|uniref:class A sortase n=1 Tax=Terribacillus saccharophilus TaxID=361277 RepID=UPI002989E66A|nr:class A sortase [Terribacillus saccharophilus]MCM3227697.1 class A sortase [Terribacillus saccharophilus]